MFFSKKTRKPEISFFVYFSKLAKYKALVSQLQGGKEHKLLYYFDQTREELENLLSAAGIQNCTISDARQYVSTIPEILTLGEVHPLGSVASQLLERVHVQSEIQCYIGLDEVFMKLFGSGRIITLMERMGMKHDERISHSMVTKSIITAQQKLDKKLPHPKDIRDTPELWASQNNLDQIAL